MWPSGSLKDKIKCLVLVGTEVPSLTPFKGDLISIGQSLLAIATETEKTAEQFSQDKLQLDDAGRYYRFNILRGARRYQVGGVEAEECYYCGYRSIHQVTDSIQADEDMRRLHVWERILVFSAAWLLVCS